MLKVLVVSHNVFSSTSNNGKTLKNIFSSFTKDEICQLYFIEENPDFSVASSYFKITDQEILKSLILNKPVGTVINYTNNAYITTSKKKASIYKNIPRVLMLFFRNVMWNFGTWNSSTLKKWIKAQNPTHVFLVAGDSTFSHNIGLVISQEYKIPLSVFFTDDYVLHPLDRNILDRLYKKILLKQYYKTIENADLCYAIGSKMADEYKFRFKKKFHPIMNCVDMIPKDSLNDNEIITISYFGGLHLNRWKSIIKFATYLNNCINFIEKPVIIKVYSLYIRSDIAYEFKKNHIQYMGGVTGNDLFKAMKDSDFFLHVESENLFDRHLTKLSISTKIPEYFIHNRPIIAYGPNEVASIQLLINKNLAFVINSESIKDKNQTEALVKLLNNKEEQEKMANNAYYYAAHNNVKEIVSEKFYNSLKQIL